VVFPALTLLAVPPSCSLRSYVEGYAFSPADVECFAAVGFPDAAAYPNAYRWYIHVAALQGVPAALLASAASSPAPAAPAAKAAPAKKAAADDEDDDEMDWDEEEDEDAPKEVVVHAPGSRGAIAAEAKAKRDAETEVKKQEAMARLAKKEANQRSLCNLEIKPWEASQDLKELYKKIQATVVMEGLKWSENCALVDVAFGVQKIVCTAVIPLSLSMDAIIDEMTEETFVDEIQSMNMTSMSLL
jgi:translation elongation factor EF-1beta/ribosomal protein L12E/L44/L45/RPP1/RPP2